MVGHLQHDFSEVITIQGVICDVHTEVARTEEIEIMEEDGVNLEIDSVIHRLDPGLDRGQGTAGHALEAVHLEIEEEEIEVLRVGLVE